MVAKTSRCVALDVRRDAFRLWCKSETLCLEHDVMPNKWRCVRCGEGRNLLGKAAIESPIYLNFSTPGVEAKAAVAYALSVLVLGVGTRVAVACVGCD
jgi:hypothetical protein